MLYCRYDEGSADCAEKPFRSGTAVKQNQNVYTLEVFVKRPRLVTSQDTGL